MISKEYVRIREPLRALRTCALDVEHVARARGLIATTNTEGAAADGQKPKWRQEYSEQLRGLPVVVLPDNDAPGKAHAQHVARALRGIAASVRVAELAGLAPKGDVSDWFNAGHTPEELNEIAYDTPEWSEAPGEEQKANDEPRVFVTLAAFIKDPELLKPPAQVIARLAYAARPSASAPVLQRISFAMGKPRPVSRYSNTVLDGDDAGTCFAISTNRPSEASVA